MDTTTDTTMATTMVITTTTIIMDMNQGIVEVEMDPTTDQDITVKETKTLPFLIHQDLTLMAEKPQEEALVVEKLDQAKQLVE
jgi:hypothetical protein